MATKAAGKYKALFIAIMLAPILVIDVNLDNDIWFLLNTGRYILSNGFPATEPFTIHSGMAFIVPQWLSAVAFWLTYNAAGIFGLYALRVVAFVATVALTYKVCMLVSEKNFMVSFGVTTFASMLLAMFFLTRPQIFSGLIFVLELYCLELHFVKKSPKYLLPLPILSLALVNLHASMWLMFFVLALPYVVDSFSFKLGFVRCAGAKKAPLIAGLAVSFCAGFLNPYGVKAMTYLLRSYGHDEISGFVSEMASPTLADSAGKVIIAAIAAVAAAYIIHRGTSTVRYALLTLGTLVLTLSSERSFMLFVIAAAFPLAFYLRSVLPEKAGEKGKSSPRMLKILTILIFAALGSTLALSVALTDLSQSQPKVAAAVDYLESSADAGGVILYAGFNSGGYTEYRGFKTYIDPRAEVFVVENNQKDDIMLEYAMLQQGQLYYKEFLAKYAFTHLLVENGDILMTYLKSDGGYAEVYSDEYCSIFCPAVQK